MRHLWFFPVLLGLVVICLGCDERGDNYVAGSVANTYRIKFDSVRIRQYASELSIEYIEKASEGEKISLKVTLDLDDGLLQAGTIYDLADRGDITRGAGYGSDLPDLDSGELKLKSYGSASGSEVQGTFSSIFMAQDGSKSNLRGGFKASLEVVE